MKPRPFSAGHFFDDTILWHDADLLSGFGQPPYEPSASEDALSAAMASYWTNFAKTGDPNGPGLVEWPQYAAASERVLALDQPLGRVDLYHRHQCKFWNTVPELFPPSASPLAPDRSAQPWSPE